MKKKSFESVQMPERITMLQHSKYKKMAVKQISVFASYYSFYYVWHSTLCGLETELTLQLFKLYKRVW